MVYWLNQFLFVLFRRSSSGDLFREILDVDDKQRQLLPSQGGDKEETYDSELKAVELLIGDDLSKKELNSLKALQVFNSLIIQIQASSKYKRKKAAHHSILLSHREGAYFTRWFLFLSLANNFFLYMYNLA